MAILSGGRFSAVTMARTFAVTLVPIAIAYHIAHHLSFLLIEAQRLIPLVSDPFGFGWNLLGTASYRSHSGIVDAWFGWYTAVITMVVGHVIAMYLAYLLALRLLRHLSLAQRSQYPMLVLLVSYTVLSLWSLGQPLVESDARVHTTLNAATAARVMDVKLSALSSGPQDGADAPHCHALPNHNMAVRAPHGTCQSISYHQVERRGRSCYHAAIAAYKPY